MPASVREWDLGKIGQLSPTEKEPKHEEKSKERERRVRREKAHHSRSPSPHDVPGNSSCNVCILQHVLSKECQFHVLCPLECDLYSTDFVFSAFSFLY